MLNFIWKGGRNKLSLSTLQAPKYQGGLRLAHLKFKHFALLIQWIKHVETRPFFKTCMYENLIPEVGTYIWMVNIAPVDVKKIVVTSTFWE